MVQTLFGPQEKKTGLFDRLKKAVASTRAHLVERIEAVVEGKESIDHSVLDDLEATLIAADLGVKTTHEILDHLRDLINRRQLREPKDLRGAVEREILATLESPAAGRGAKSDAGRAAAAPKKAPEGFPEVIFVVGVNGVGKTTSIAKLANLYCRQERSHCFALPTPSEQRRQNSSRSGPSGWGSTSSSRGPALIPRLWSTTR